MRLVLLLAGLLLVTAEIEQPESERPQNPEPTEGQDASENDAGYDGGYTKEVEDPCAKKHCTLGHECDLDENGDAICVCSRNCPNKYNDRSEEDIDRIKVCSTQNVTFANECELYRQKCLCHKHNPEECTDPKNKHAHLDYYGPCKEISPCDELQLKEYPSRMRDWLYLVMEELASRNDLNAPAKRMALQAERHNKKWVIPAIWKFCDLDRSHDRLVDTQELLPISAPLKPLEHCTGPFLHQCDEDSSGYIDLQEWGKCLGLDPEEIEDRCEEIRND